LEDFFPAVDVEGLFIDDDFETFFSYWVIRERP